MTTKNQTHSASAPVSLADIIEDSAYQVLTKNIPLFALRGLRKEHMDALYAQGYYFYSQAKYQEALPLFKGLTLYDSLDQRGWLGAAGCYEMLKQYEQALTCYSFATVLNADDPTPPLHAFDCYIALKNYPKALACLEAVILLSSKEEKYATLKKRAESLREILQRTNDQNKQS